LSNKLTKVIKEELAKYYENFDLDLENSDIKLVANWDEIGVFFENNEGSTFEIKGKEHVSVFATGK
jgi:hypothetical protein